MNINSLIKEKNWIDVVFHYEPEAIAASLPFHECLKVASHLLYNEEWDGSLQEFAIQLLETLRNFKTDEWNSSWIYDGFLGQAYDIILNYDERYNAFHRAFGKVDPKSPPPQLLIALASCCECPGKPPVSYDQAIIYLKASLKDYLYVDGVSLIRKVYWLKEDKKNEMYWENVFREIENRNIHSPSFEPAILKSL